MKRQFLVINHKCTLASANYRVNQQHQFLHLTVALAVESNLDYLGIGTSDGRVRRISIRSELSFSDTNCYLSFSPKVHPDELGPKVAF